MQAHQWGCRSCGHGYALGAIEAQLVHAARVRARAFQLQDLRCAKCRQVGSRVSGFGPIRGPPHTADARSCNPQGAATVLPRFTPDEACGPGVQAARSVSCA